MRVIVKKMSGAEMVLEVVLNKADRALLFSKEEDAGGNRIYWQARGDLTDKIVAAVAAASDVPMKDTRVFV